MIEQVEKSKKDFVTVRIKDRWFLLVLIISACLLSLMVLKPLNFNNQQYQDMALELYRFGKIPYIGTWDQNFPGIIYIHYLIVLLFGPSDIGIRLFDVFVQLVFVAFLYRFWLRWLKPHTAALAAVLYIAYYVSGSFMLLSQRDVYGGMLTVLSLYLLIRARNSPRSRVLLTAASALIAGYLIVLRPTGLLPVSLLALSVAFNDSFQIVWRRVWIAVLYFLCALMPIAIVLGYYASIPHGLESMYLATIRWNLDLYGRIDNGFVLLLGQFARRAFLTPLAIYGLFVWRRSSLYFSCKPTRWEVVIYSALLAGYLFIAFLMRKYFDYHFAPFYMLLMPLPAIAIERIADRFSNPLRHHYAIVFGVYAATLLAYAPKAPLSFGVALMAGQNPMEYAYEVQSPSPMWGAIPERQTMAYMDRKENRQGLVEVCSFTNNLRLHLRREAAGRFVNLLALAYRLNPDDEGRPLFTDYQKRWQREYVDSLRIKQPRFIIVARQTPFGYFADVYDDCLKWVPGFDSLLQSSYHRNTVIGGFNIYQLRSDVNR
jgi:hypothetical protein